MPTKTKVKAEKKRALIKSNKAKKVVRQPQKKKVSKKHRSSHSSSSSSKSGISSDAMVLMALAQHQNNGQPLDAIIPWLLLTGNNSLKTNLIPLVIYHLQSNGGAAASNCRLLPYLLAFQNGTLHKNDLLLYMTQMKDQFGQPMLGNGMGGNNLAALAMLSNGGRIDPRALLLVQYLQGNHGYTNEEALAQIKWALQNDPAGMASLGVVTAANAAQIAEKVVKSEPGPSIKTEPGPSGSMLFDSSGRFKYNPLG